MAATTEVKKGKNPYQKVDGGAPSGGIADMEVAMVPEDKK